MSDPRKVSPEAAIDVLAATMPIAKKLQDALDSMDVDRLMRTIEECAQELKVSLQLDEIPVDEVRNMIVSVIDEAMGA